MRKENEPPTGGSLRGCSSVHSYTAALRQGTQYQPPQAPQTYGRRLAASATTGNSEKSLSIQAPSSSNNDVKSRHCMQLIIVEFIKIVSEEEKATASVV